MVKYLCRLRDPMRGQANMRNVEQPRDFDSPDVLRLHHEKKSCLSTDRGVKHDISPGRVQRYYSM
jgi:hypothetical protein